MNRPTVVLDVDGVVADFVGHTLSILGDRAPVRSSLRIWGVTDQFSDEDAQLCHLRWRAPGWCRTMPVLPWSYNAVDRLSLRANVLWATAPLPNAPHWVAERTAWLVQHFAADPKSIFFVEDKSLVPGDIMVDDKPENVDKWATAHPNGTALLWDAPYNEGWAPSTPNAHRVERWSQVFEALNVRA